PERAMDSMRMYFSRQDTDGYIPYRIGSYLNETIEETGLPRTSSGPFLSWICWSIYQKTKDKAFLQESLEHGEKSYEWWMRERDKDKDGLCEWGGNPVLECLRDSYNVILFDAFKEHFQLAFRLKALDLNCMLVSEAHALHDMAETLGDPEEA